MCEFCNNYDFGRVAVKIDLLDGKPTLYFAGGYSIPPKEERFKYCPVCGERLSDKNFKYFLVSSVKK